MECNATHLISQVSCSRATQKFPQLCMTKIANDCCHVKADLHGVILAQDCHMRVSYVMSTTQRVSCRSNSQHP